jgi:hypothetical protein
MVKPKTVMVDNISSFRGEDFLEINQSKTKWHVATMFVHRSELNEQSL